MKARVAFYKAKYGNWQDKLIAFWTFSRYSHCELVIGDTWYTSSHRDGGVRAKKIIPNLEHWDFLPVLVDEEFVTDFFARTKGEGYDWINIFFSQIIPLRLQNSSKWVCSEWVAYAICRKQTSYAPGGLYKRLKKKFKGMLNV